MGLVNIPLSGVNQILASGQVFPSGEANFADTRQYLLEDNKGINQNFPTEYAQGGGSGVLATFPENSGLYHDQENPGSGIFNREGISSNFSNSEDYIGDGINDFTIFNNYIHFERSKHNEVTSIPYVSTYTVVVNNLSVYGDIV